MRMRVPKEAEEQIALVQWWRISGLGTHDDLVKNTNEGKRTGFQGAYLKRMGMIPGTSDLFLSLPRGPFSGLWIEIKRNLCYPPSERNKPTWRAQEAFLERKRETGYAAEFVFGFEHGRKLITWYMDLPCPDRLTHGAPRFLGGDFYTMGAAQ